MSHRVYLSNKNPIDFTFTQSPGTFHVRENRKFSLQRQGDFRLIEVEKVKISTIELIEYLCEVLRIKPYQIGYAGLKDKHATAVQYITIPRNISIKKFNNSQRVKLKEIGFLAEPLKVGMLDSNSFRIVLTNITADSYTQLKSAMERISQIGFANYFGYQRFGVLNDSIEKGKKISDYGKGAKNQKSRILLAAYQSKAFNSWLTKRLEISDSIISDRADSFLQNLSPALLNAIKSSSIPYKLLPGDLGYIYKKRRKIFENCSDINKYNTLFKKRFYHPTGVLFGSHVRFATSLAGRLEREYIDYSFDSLRGARRDAWVFLKDVSLHFKQKSNEATVEFTLPPGSYATVVLEELLNRELF